MHACMHSFTSNPLLPSHSIPLYLLLDPGRPHNQRTHRKPPPPHLPIRHRPPLRLHLVQHLRKILPHPLPQPAPPPILRIMLGPRCHLGPGGSNQDCERGQGGGCRFVDSVYFELWRGSGGELSWGVSYGGLSVD